MIEFASLEKLKPISNIEIIFVHENQGTEESPGIFQDILMSKVNNVINTDDAVVNDTESLAVGESDDLHTLNINNYKAYLSLNMLIQMRNKALDAYTQIMQITV